MPGGSNFWHMECQKVQFLVYKWSEKFTVNHRRRQTISVEENGKEQESKHGDTGIKQLSVEVKLA